MYFKLVIKEKIGRLKVSVKNGWLTNLMHIPYNKRDENQFLIDQGWVAENLLACVSYPQERN